MSPLIHMWPNYTCVNRGTCPQSNSHKWNRQERNLMPQGFIISSKLKTLQGPYKWRLSNTNAIDDWLAYIGSSLSPDKFIKAYESRMKWLQWNIKTVASSLKQACIHSVQALKSPQHILRQLCNACGTLLCYKCSKYALLSPGIDSQQ